MALGMTVADMSARMTTEEFADWLAFERVEPFGSPAAHWRSALIASILANVNRDPKKTKSFKISDFMPETSLSRTMASRAMSENILAHLRATSPNKDKA